MSSTPRQVCGSVHVDQSLRCVPVETKVYWCQRVITVTLAQFCTVLCKRFWDITFSSINWQFQFSKMQLSRRTSVLVAIEIQYGRFYWILLIILWLYQGHFNRFWLFWGSVPETFAQYCISLGRVVFTRTCSFVVFFGSLRGQITLNLVWETVDWVTKQKCSVANFRQLCFWWPFWNCSTAKRLFHWEFCW